MAINADKPQQWKKDIGASVDLFNQWFIKFAPRTYRDTRLKTTELVEEALTLTNDLRAITPEILAAHPKVLPTLRMSTAPPLAPRPAGRFGLHEQKPCSRHGGRINSSAP
jgi:hypothetical protein